MSKDNGDLYFPHDFNSSNDEKMIAFLSLQGAEGYGIFWLIVEQMHKNEGIYKKKEYNYLATAERSKATAERIKAILSDLVNCELFYTDDDGYYSERVIKNLEKSKKISQQNAENARKRAIKTSDRSTTVSDRSTTANIQDKTKEDKIKEEKKKDKKEIPPVPVELPSDENLKIIFFEELKNRCKLLEMNYPEDIDKLKAEEKCLVYIEYCHKYYGTKKQYKDYKAASRTFLTEVSRLRNYKKPDGNIKDEKDEIICVKWDDLCEKLIEYEPKCRPGDIYNFLRWQSDIGKMDGWNFLQVWQWAKKLARSNEYQWNQSQIEKHENKKEPINKKGIQQINQILGGM